MAEQPADAEDGQLPPLSDFPYPVLKRIFQYVCSNGGKDQIQLRLVCRSFNYQMLMNMRLHVNYKITTSVQDRCSLSSWRKFIPTEDLINSSLIDNITSMTTTMYDRGYNWDQQDLIRLASEFSQPVNMSLLASFNSPILLPLEEMPLIRLVKVDITAGNDLTPTEVDFMASLQHLSQLSMSERNLSQLDQRVDLLKISELKVDREFSSFPDLDVNFSDNFINLSYLEIISIDLVDDWPISFSFNDVQLPHLIKCHLGIRVSSLYTLPSVVDSTRRLLTSMQSAMPSLKVITYAIKLRCEIYKPNEVRQLISVIFRSCPATVEDFDLDFIRATLNQPYLQSLSRFKWIGIFRSLFNAVLNSNVTRVSFRSDLNPVGFKFKKSRSGEQLGLPEESTKLYDDRDLRVCKYQLQKDKNGQIATLDIMCKSIW